MVRKKRDWHPNFKEYMNYIINHPNYSGMPYSKKNDRSIQWVVTGNSTAGKKRKEWWERKAMKLGIAIQGKWISKTAKEIHPTKEKVCQTCGKVKSIKYIYPGKNLVKSLNKIQGLENTFSYTDFDTVDEIVRKIIGKCKSDGYIALVHLFKIPSDVKKTLDDYLRYIYNSLVKNEKIFSPGAMSNAPDRLDGFHTYNICCRASEDTGRHVENLSRYNEDRRAYEHWSDGDWKVSSWFMKKFNQGKGTCLECKAHGKITADHIGPISLGFAHLPEFQPLCRSCNSAKNNRMFFKDVKKLITLEMKGKKVNSWHSKYIWDRLKHQVHTDSDSKELSKHMRYSHHLFLEMFYYISYNGYKDFLLNYLNPQHAYFEKIAFVGLDNSTFRYERINKVEGSKKQYHNNAARYIRIAFDSLDNYHEKNNRQLIDKPITHFGVGLENILTSLKNDLSHNHRLRNMMNSASKILDKKTREETIKKALEEFETNPYKNNQADLGIKNTIKKMTDHIIKFAGYFS